MGYVIERNFGVHLNGWDQILITECVIGKGLKFTFQVIKVFRL